MKKAILILTGILAFAGSFSHADESTEHGRSSACAVSLVTSTFIYDFETEGGSLDAYSNASSSTTRLHQQGFSQPRTRGTSPLCVAHNQPSHTI